MLRFMLDTNIVIYVIKRRPIEVLDIFNCHAGQMSFSSITLAELLHGVEKSEMPNHNLLRVEDFISRLEVLPYGEKAAGHYGEIRAGLERKGIVIGVNDLHIAGHARSEVYYGDSICITGTVYGTMTFLRRALDLVSAAATNATVLFSGEQQNSHLPAVGHNSLPATRDEYIN